MSSYEDLKNDFRQKMIVEEIAPTVQRAEQAHPFDNDPQVYSALLKEFHNLATRAGALEKENTRLNSLLDDCIKVLDLFKERVIPIPRARLGPMMMADGSQFIYVAVNEKEEVKWVKSGREIEKEQEKTIPV